MDHIEFAQRKMNLLLGVADILQDLTSNAIPLSSRFLECARDEIEALRRVALQYEVEALQMEDARQAQVEGSDL